VAVLVANRKRICAKALIFLVLPHRIELWTSPLPRECSTTELRQQGAAGAPPEARGNCHKGWQGARKVPEARVGMWGPRRGCPRRRPGSGGLFLGFLDGRLSRRPAFRVPPPAREEKRVLCTGLILEKSWIWSDGALVAAGKRLFLFADPSRPLPACGRRPPRRLGLPSLNPRACSERRLPSNQGHGPSTLRGR
jgi:hypothetical protein